VRGVQPRGALFQLPRARFLLPTLPEGACCLPGAPPPPLPALPPFSCRLLLLRFLSIMSATEASAASPLPAPLPPFLPSFSPSPLAVSPSGTSPSSPSYPSRNSASSAPASPCSASKPSPCNPAPVLAPGARPSGLWGLLPPFPACENFQWDLRGPGLGEAAHPRKAPPPLTQSPLLPLSTLLPLPPLRR